MSFELRIEQVGDEHIEPYAKLSRAEYGDTAAVSQPIHLRWKFLDNPQGATVGVHLYKDGDLVGRMVALTRKFVYKGATYKAAHIVDFLVHPNDRGMMSLFQLTTGLKKLEGFDFQLIMAPNAAGAAVWDKFVKMRGYFDLNVAVAPLRPASLLHSAGKIKSAAIAPPGDFLWRLFSGPALWTLGLFNRAQIETDWPLPEEIDAMFAADPGERVIGLRTADFLDWRYRRSPVFRYKIFFVREGGKLCGYFVTRRNVYDGIDCLFVVDAYGLPEIRHSALRAASFAALRSEKRDVPEMAMILGNLHCKPFAALNGLPFVTVPPRFLPRKTTVYAQWMKAPAFEIEPDNFYVALGDSDVI